MDWNSPDIFRELLSNSWHFTGFPADGDGVMRSRLSHWCSENDQKSEFERRLDCIYLPRNPSGESSYSHSPLALKTPGSNICNVPYTCPYRVVQEILNITSGSGYQKPK